jgi:hypothetical protein
MSIKNPYLKEFKKHQKLFKKNNEFDIGYFMSSFKLREALTRKYAWAIPSNDVIREIIKHGPVVEMGAGRGYWAYLMKQSGAKVLAFDKMTNKDQWFPVKKGRTNQLSKIPKTYKTLLLCWPHFAESIGISSLKRFKGKYVIYVGERSGGCTGDPAFHAYLEKKYTLKKVMIIPTWAGIHDRVFIYEKTEI